MSLLQEVKDKMKLILTDLEGRYFYGYELPLEFTTFLTSNCFMFNDENKACSYLLEHIQDCRKFYNFDDMHINPFENVDFYISRMWLVAIEELIKKCSFFNDCYYDNIFIDDKNIETITKQINSVSCIFE